MKLNRGGLGQEQVIVGPVAGVGNGDMQIGVAVHDGEGEVAGVSQFYEHRARGVGVGEERSRESDLDGPTGLLVDYSLPGPLAESQTCMT